MPSMARKIILKLRPADNKPVSDIALRATSLTGLLSVIGNEMVHKDYTNQEISKIFKNFSEFECKGNSNLYYLLCKDISEDYELIEIASNTRVNQPIPNSFLSSIHYLLLKNKHSELSNYYPSITGQFVDRIPFNLFKEFVLQNKHEIIELISNKIVQTNVISRCSYLMPILSKIINSENLPTTIIDIGSSSGLNLNFDRYEYHYNNIKIYGNSSVKIESEILKGEIPEINRINAPLTKIGIDQNIIDYNNLEEVLWLKSLIWADQVNRFYNLEEALKDRDLNKITFIKGSSIDDFKKVILNVNKNHNLIIYTTHVLYQFTDDLLKKFFDMIESIGKTRDLYYLSVEGTKLFKEKYSSNTTVIELSTFKNGKKVSEFIGETNGHGNWVKWN